MKTLLRIFVLGILMLGLVSPLTAEPEKLTVAACGGNVALYRLLSNPDWRYGDHLWRGQNNYNIQWDASLYTLHLGDNVELGFGNTSTTPDIWMRWDGTNFDILSSTAGYDLTIGTAAAAIDLIWQSDTSGDSVTFDEENVKVTFTDVDLELAGGSLLYGQYLSVVDDTDGVTLTEADSGTVQTNAGASGAAAWTLPAAAAGLEYYFVVGAAQELRVTPASGDKINHAGTLAGDAEYYYADAIGEALHIICIDAIQWVVISETGTWAEQTP